MTPKAINTSHFDKLDSNTISTFCLNKTKRARNTIDKVKGQVTKQEKRHISDKHFIFTIYF